MMSARGVIYPLLVFSLLFAVKANASVIIHDSIAVRGKPFMLMAETRGRFFPKGGQVVEFFVDGKSIGKNLSGGDGIAFKEFIPLKRGLYEISVEAGGSKGKGLLLSLNKGNGIVFVDVEGSLLDELFSMKPKEGSQKALKRISERFPIVYLQTQMLGRGILKDWLKKNGFQKAPLLPWEEGAIFKEVEEKGLKIRALIASPSVIESVAEYEPKAFSFDDVEGAEEVKDWEDIDKKIR